jgi:hypothetical protein
MPWSNGSPSGARGTLASTPPRPHSSTGAGGRPIDARAILIRCLMRFSHLARGDNPFQGGPTPQRRGSARIGVLSVYIYSYTESSLKQRSEQLCHCPLPHPSGTGRRRKPCREHASATPTSITPIPTCRFTWLASLDLTAGRLRYLPKSQLQEKRPPVRGPDQPLAASGEAGARGRPRSCVGGAAARLATGARRAAASGRVGVAE